MRVAEPITALQSLKQDAPISHELLAEIALVDEPIYMGGQASFHPPIYAFRKQRFLRAAAAAKCAIAKLREAGWDARVTRKSLRGETAFVQHISFVVVPITPRPEDDVTFRQQDAAEKLVEAEMAGWPYDIDAGWVVKHEYHQEEFAAALSIDDIEFLMYG